MITGFWGGPSLTFHHHLKNDLGRLVAINCPEKIWNIGKEPNPLKRVRDETLGLLACFLADFGSRTLAGSLRIFTQFTR